MPKITLSQKAIAAGYTSLGTFLDMKWTEAQLLEQGWAVEVETPKPAAAADVSVPPIVAPLSAHGERQPAELKKGTAVANLFGIKDLEVVTLAFREFGGPQRGRYPAGWSYEQQILFAAEHLVRTHAAKVKEALS